MQHLTDQPSGKSLEIRVPVRFGDTDPYGVVYFASYFRYCHHGIEEFLRHHGLRPEMLFRNEDQGYGLPIVGAACDFLKPVRYGAILRLRVSIARVGEKSLTFAFHFYPEQGEACLARGQATLVAIDRSWRSRPLPEELLAAAVPRSQARGDR